MKTAKKILSLVLVMMMLFSMSMVATSAYTSNGAFEIATAPKDTAKEDINGDVYGIIGDADMSEAVNVRDATLIQKFAADIEPLTEVQKVLADVNFDEKVNVRDATAIQKWVASIEISEPVGQYIYAPAEDPTEVPSSTAPITVPTTVVPSTAPTTEVPTQAPSSVDEPTQGPTEVPTELPTEVPTQASTEAPTQAPSSADEPTQVPTTAAPTTAAPTTVAPTDAPVETEITVYFTNNEYWSEVYAYYWGGEANVTWPGEKMTFAKVNKYGQDIYSAVIPANVEGLLFDAGEGQPQTVDITENIADGKGFYCVEEVEGKWTVDVYDYIDDEPAETTAASTTAPATTSATTTATTTAAPTTVAPTDAPVLTASDYAIRGTFTDWGSNDAIYYVADSNTVIEATYELAAGEYKFKVYNMTTSVWYGNDGTIDGACENWGFRDGKGDATLNITEAGKYTITIDVSDAERLAVTIAKAVEVPATTAAPTTAAPTTVAPTQAPSSADEPTVAPTTAAPTTAAPTTVAPTDAPVETEITVYFTNNEYWSEVYAYYWGGDANVTWPGEKMTFVKVNKYGQDIYSAVIPANVEGLIFDAGNNMPQTVDITENIADGKGFYCTDEVDGKWAVDVYDYIDDEPAETTAATTTAPVTTASTTAATTTAPATTGSTTAAPTTVAPTEAPVLTASDYAIRGTFTDWGSNDAIYYVADSNTVIEATYELAAGEYKFKVYNMTTSVWYGNDGTIDGACENWGFRDGKGDATLNITEAGKYTITIDVSDATRLAVTIAKAVEVPATTAAPTTAAPTTAAPTTVAPTTAAPTTVAPTTAAPTTAAPTTVAPTTAAPTTAAPTTAAPTTVAPTTAAPTTAAPTTVAPTTVAPTTAAPTTAAPTTAPATTTPVEDEPTTHITVYFTNNENWSEVYAYYWGTAIDPQWPGEKMTFVKVNKYGQDIYSALIPVEATGLLFDAGEGQPQTVDITENIADGKGFYCVEEVEGKWTVDVYDYIDDEPAETTAASTTAPATTASTTTATTTVAPTDAPVLTASDYAIRGTFTDWGSNDAIYYVADSNTVIEATYELAAGEYKFKVYNMTTSVWYGNDGTIDGACENWGFRDGKGDATLNITEAGKYTITIDVSDAERLAVTIAKAVEVPATTAAPTTAAPTTVAPTTAAPTTAAPTTVAPTTAPTEAPTEAPTDPPVMPEYTVYFVNSGKWSKVNAYVWSPEAATWPGVAMVKTDEKAPNGADVYSLTLPDTYDNIIFNDGSSQTSDLTYEEGKYYDYATGKWYANLDEIPAEGPAGYTVYCVNSKNWSKINAYVWSPSGAGWPGSAMTKTGEKAANGSDIYSITFAQKHGNIIFNNGSGTQTSDLTFQAGQYFDLSTNKWYASAADVK